VAFNGAEPIRATTLRRFAEAFKPFGFASSAFLPCYGLAECTLFASGSAGLGIRTLEVDSVALSEGRVAPPTTPAKAVELVSCGPPAADSEIRIVDADLKILPAAQIGEICLAGPHISQGYWQDPQATEQSHDVRLGVEPQGYLRTGDLGFAHEGDLYVVSRLKDLIIQRGRNIYPSDIERICAAASFGVQASSFAAVGVTSGRGQDVLLVVELKRGVERRVDLLDLGKSFRQTVLEAQDVSLAAVAFIGPGQMPRTTSGKVKRQGVMQAVVSGAIPVLTWVGHLDTEPTAHVPGQRLHLPARNGASANVHQK
jgi:acyl-CoA synthetase (AMP-forming)/AMP-acid ligase II